MGKRKRIIVEKETGLIIRPGIHKRIHEIRKELGYTKETKESNEVRESNHALIWDHIKRDLNNLSCNERNQEAGHQHQH